MERLTMNNGICQMASTEFCLSQKDCYSCPHGRKCFKRLAAYEDAGLEPEEVKEHEAAYAEIMTRTYGPIHEKIGQWLQAEKDGRLVVLPCKVGQTIWVESCIRGRSTSIEAPDIEWIIENAERFGAEIFLTREEAEAALKKRDED